MVMNGPLPSSSMACGRFLTVTFLMWGLRSLQLCSKMCWPLGRFVIYYPFDKSKKSFHEMNQDFMWYEIIVHQLYKRFLHVSVVWFLKSILVSVPENMMLLPFNPSQVFSRLFQAMRLLCQLIIGHDPSGLNMILSQPLRESNLDQQLTQPRDDVPPACVHRAMWRRCGCL